MLNGKHILLGVSSSIACYKSAELVRQYVKAGAEVQVVMTENAAKLISPLLFEQLSKHHCITDTFERPAEVKVAHISLADWADVFVAAPADANVIAKFAHGIADDMLSTTMLACDCEKIIAPAMNTKMYENPATQDNLALLARRGFHIMDTAYGELACGVTGAGRMAEPAQIAEYTELLIGYEKDLAGKKILITSGPTREAMDPVRFITNHSTGKMGTAIARAAAARGAETVIVHGVMEAKVPAGVKAVPVTSAQDMYDAVMAEADSTDIFIMAAAVADYRPKTTADQKMKKKDGELTLELARTKDILGTLGADKKDNWFLCGFSMETEHVLENSRKKLEKKNLDLIVANSIKQAGAGFGTDTNIVTMISKEAEDELPIMSKDDVAHKILDRILEMSGPH